MYNLRHTNCQIEKSLKCCIESAGAKPVFNVHANVVQWCLHRLYVWHRIFSGCALHVTILLRNAFDRTLKMVYKSKFFTCYSKYRISYTHVIF